MSTSVPSARDQVASCDLGSYRMDPTWTGAVLSASEQLPLKQREPMLEMRELVNLTEAIDSILERKATKRQRSKGTPGGMEQHEGRGRRDNPKDALDEYVPRMVLGPGCCSIILRWKHGGVA